MEYGASKYGGPHALSQVAGTPTPKGERDSDVLRELEVMEKEIARLGDAFGHLAERIEPICRPAEPVNVAGQPGLDRVTSAFADRLRGLRMQIARIGDHVASTHQRLDL